MTILVCTMLHWHFFPFCHLFNCFICDFFVISFPSLSPPSLPWFLFRPLPIYPFVHLFLLFSVHISGFHLFLCLLIPSFLNLSLWFLFNLYSILCLSLFLCISLSLLVCQIVSLLLSLSIPSYPYFTLSALHLPVSFSSVACHLFVIMSCLFICITYWIWIAKLCCSLSLKIHVGSPHKLTGNLEAKFFSKFNITLNSCWCVLDDFKKIKMLGF